ncbi:5-methylthioadenosine/S-adenosylhomocysteine deaminase [Sinobacterium norvegicum]|uniref:5-methylthioadenosine/S-adenosylhomocysteine deaminase n=1 Tax=Sinobacterium norvegicum TaxID=1641715 RepID=A0ABN8EEK1_9GAMM|nr:TRZ/ATZ family hydrolase [Sinobacterium norvegicum]CAH0990763.1 5-methylthioadenosine/S-adenosylhomocysteine deaminase [Sinobacterium norvegicum]
MTAHKIAVDTTISADWLAAVDQHNPAPSSGITERQTIAIDNGIIVAIGDSETILADYQGRQHHQLDQHLLIPGLINAHGHSAMTLLRGYADDYPLMEWLQQHIWPAEQQWVEESFVRDGSDLAIAEMLLGGTTCFSDMYFFPEQTAAACIDAGMRAQLCFPILDFPNNWSDNADDAIDKGLALASATTDSLISFAFGPHAPYTVGDDSMKKIVNLAKQHQLAVQIHCHETQHEVDDAIKETGKRPLQRLDELGLLSDNTQLVHMTALNDDDIAITQRSGASVIHCPESNLKLASGFCPVQQLHHRDINVAIGTDGAASNNDLDLLGELRTAALLAKAVASDASAVNTQQALAMATINGAKALGLDDKIGSLEIGKFADIVAIDMGTVTAQPVYNPLSQLIYGNNSAAINHVWVAGEQKVCNRQLTSLDADNIYQRACVWRDKIKKTS